MDGYLLQWLPSHLFALGDDERLVGLLKDFRYLMEKTRRGMLERLLDDSHDLPARLTGNRELLMLERAFFLEKAHVLRRGDEKWPANRILLQLGAEHADDSPVTLGAESWLAAERCDWLWLRNPRRVGHATPNACLRVLEGHTGSVFGATEYTDGRILSWSSDHTLRLWTADGFPVAVLRGHGRMVIGATVLTDGRILSQSCSNPSQDPDPEENMMRRWTAGGAPDGSSRGTPALFSA
jgi:WD40 repeat protein